MSNPAPRSPTLPTTSRLSADTIMREKELAQFENNDLDNDTIVNQATSAPSSSSSSQQPRGRASLAELLPHFWAMPHLFTKSTFIWMFATTFVMIVYIWLYLGALWQPLNRVKNVDILFYNGDAGFDYTNTPPQIQQLTMGITKNQSLGDIVQQKIMDPQGPMVHVVRWNDWSGRKGLSRDELVDQVEKGEFWGLLYIPANFSNNMLTYAPSNAGPPAQPQIIDMEYVFDQGRGYGTHSIIEKYISRSLDAFGRAFESGLLTSPANSTLLATMHPTFWVNTLHYTETIMHPVKIYGANFASYVIFIVLYIGAMLTVYSIAKFLPNTIESMGILGLEVNEITGHTVTPNRPFNKFPALQIAIARYFLAILFSLIHTIFIWMVPQVLHGHQNAGGNAGQAFFFIWFTSWSFVSILSFLCQLMTADGFQGPATMLMILMFTSSSGILDWVVMPGFFRVGYAFPFTYGVRGMRYFYFGSQESNMWLNWVVILAWTVVPGIGTMLLARTNIRLRRQALRSTLNVQQA